MLINYALELVSFKNQSFLYESWKDLQEDGKRKDRWDGNGREKDLKKRREEEDFIDREQLSYKKTINVLFQQQQYL